MRNESFPVVKLTRIHWSELRCCDNGLHSLTFGSGLSSCKSQGWIVWKINKTTISRFVKSRLFKKRCKRWPKLEMHLVYKVHCSFQKIFFSTTKQSRLCRVTSLTLPRLANTVSMGQLKAGGTPKGHILAGYYGLNANISFTFYAIKKYLCSYHISTFLAFL